MNAPEPGGASGAREHAERCSRGDRRRLTLGGNTRPRARGMRIARCGDSVGSVARPGRLQLFVIINNLAVGETLGFLGICMLRYVCYERPGEPQLHRRDFIVQFPLIRLLSPRPTSTRRSFYFSLRRSPLSRLPDTGRQFHFCTLIYSTTRRALRQTNVRRHRDYSRTGYGTLADAASPSPPSERAGFLRYLR